jgi:hypothetical protein
MKAQAERTMYKNAQHLKRSFVLNDERKIFNNFSNGLKSLIRHLVRMENATCQN